MFLKEDRSLSLRQAHLQTNGLLRAKPQYYQLFVFCQIAQYMKGTFSLQLLDAVNRFVLECLTKCESRFVRAAPIHVV